MARALEPPPGRAFPSPGRQQKRIVVNRQRERMRRANVIWVRQRAVFIRMLVESMEEFGISQAELSVERRKLAVASRGKRKAATRGAAHTDPAASVLPQAASPATP